MDIVTDPKLDMMMNNIMPTGILDMLMQTTDLTDGLSLEYEAGQPTELGDTVIGIVNHGMQAAAAKELITDPLPEILRARSQTGVASRRASRPRPRDPRNPAYAGPS